MLLLPNDNLGGAEQYLKMVAEYLKNKSYHVDVYFLKKRITGAWEHLANDKVKLYYTKKRTEKYGALSVFFKFLFKNRKQYDYIFTSHIHINSFVDILRRLRLINSEWHIARESTSIYSRYSGFKLKIFDFYYRIGYNKTDLIICQTDFMFRQLINGAPFLLKRRNIVVIPNPVNLNILKSNYSDQNFQYSNYIVSAGRLIPEKGFEILIDAFQGLNFIYPTLKLIILGEGDLREQLQQKIFSLDLQHNVIMPGFVDNVYSYFKNAEVCVVSSIIEGFPNVLLQMMSQNDKVVSTLCAGGIEEIEGVVTCPTNDSKKLLEAINTIIYKDKTSNRLVFNEELSNRSIDRFIEKVKESLTF